MKRAEHLQWAKNRAFEYIDAGDVSTGWTSFVSDLSKHAELAGHTAIELGMLQILGGLLSTPAQMREFIDGTN